MKAMVTKNGNWKKWQIMSGLLLFLFIIMVLVWPKAPDPPDSIASIAELEAYVKKLTDFGTPQGISFVVVRNNQIIYSKGFGWADHPHKIPATPDAVYHWYSMTKIVTAMAVFQLQEKGALQLDDPVVRYLSFFKVKYPSDSSKIVTIRDLLNHSSGIPDATFDLVNWVHYEGEPSVHQTDFVKKIFPKYSKLMFEPGDYSQYTNIGYMVLGAIIEKVSGQTYEEYVRQNILVPLGMNHTDFIYTKVMEPYEAAGSNPVFNFNTIMLPFVRGKIVRELSQNHIWFNRFYNDQTPPSGLIGSPADASRLAMAYLNHGELDGTRILSKESVFMMTHDGYKKAKDQKTQDSFRQGYAWQTWSDPGRLVIQHDGGGPGFYTKMQLIPDENLGFIIFTNDISSRDKINKIVNLAASLKW
jgi:CubicO group peptidase (beta-lactamase class C family)